MHVRKIVAAATVAAGLAAALAFATSGAVAVPAPGANLRLAGQGFTSDFGNKHAVGFFLRDGGACALHVVLTQKEGDDFVVGAGASVDVAVAAGQAVKLQSGEGHGLELGCAENAASMSITTVGSGA